MSSYAVISDFRGGIDWRRPPAVGVPGTLWDARNVHITPGGDIEKRMGFAPVQGATLPPNTFGLHALGDELWVFGSEDLGMFFPTPTDPPIRYQRLVLPDEPTRPMTRLLWAGNFAGMIYAIADFNGRIAHFYDGVIVQDWEELSIPVNNNAAALNKFKQILEATGLFSSVTVSGSQLTMTFKDYEPHNVRAGVEHLGTPTSGNLVASLVAQPVQPQSGQEAVGIITFVSRGSSGSREMRKIEVQQDTLVDLLDYASAGPVVWASGVTPEDFALLVRDRINANTNAGVSHGWTAVTVGASVWFSPPQGTYEAGNGIDCYYTKANIQIAQPVAPAVGYVTKGGRNPVSGVHQQNILTISGVFNMNAEYWVEIDGARYVVKGYDVGHPRFAIVHRSRVYAPTRNILYFSALGNPRRWLSGIGHGYIEIESQGIDGDPITALAPFQGKLAVFQASSLQIWNLPADEQLANLLSMVNSAGAVSPYAVLDVGGMDTFFLTRYGIRSVKARALTDAPFVADVGSPVDAHLQNQLRAGYPINPNDLLNAKALINPRDGRIWFLIGRGRHHHLIYVLSLFPESKIAAWTTYQLGIDVQDIVATSSRLFARDEFNVYEYGGPHGDNMAEGGVVVYSVRTPFFDLRRPGSAKGVPAVEFVVQGSWYGRVFIKPYDPWNGEIELGDVRAVHQAASPRPLPAHAPALAFELASNVQERGSISQIIIHNVALPKF